MKFRALKSAEILVKHFERKETQKQVKKARLIALKKMLSGYEGSHLIYNFFREFDPGSGLTLAACITHSSRTE